MAYLSLFCLLLLIAALFTSRRTSWLARESTHHAGAGIAVAYVFLDIFPHLASQHDALQRASTSGPLSFLTSHVYLLALLSFAIYLGLAKFGDERSKEMMAGHIAPHTNPYSVLRVLAWCVYCMLIGYLIADQPDHRREPVIIFTLAMLIHLAGLRTTIRISMSEVHDWRVSSIFAGAALVGWLLGVAIDVPYSVVALMFSFASGAILATATIYELPIVMKGDGYKYFCFGLIGFSALLLLYESLSNLE